MALEGTLQDMSLSDLFQVFRLGPKSGILIIEKAEERTVIFVDRGTLIDAFVVRGAERKVIATGDEAVLHALAWNDAHFVFRHDLSVAGRSIQIKHDSEWLVLESMRRRSDPLRTMPYQQITLDTILRLSPLPSSAESSVSLDVDQWRILSHAASNQNLRAICKATGIEHDRALRIVAELLSIGLVEVVSQKAAESQKSARKPEPRRASPEPALEPSVAGMVYDDKKGNGSKSQAGVGRGLLNAIMRRINEL